MAIACVRVLVTLFFHADLFLFLMTSLENEVLSCFLWTFTPWAAHSSAFIKSQWIKQITLCSIYELGQPPCRPPPPQCCKDLDLLKQKILQGNCGVIKNYGTRKHWCHVRGDQRDTDQCRPCNTEGCISCTKAFFCRGQAWLRDMNEAIRERDKEMGVDWKRAGGKCELSFTFNVTAITYAASGICQVHQMCFWQSYFSGNLVSSLSLTVVLDENLIWPM